MGGYDLARGVRFFFLFLWIFPRERSVVEMLFLLVSDTSRNMHRIRIFRIWVRIDLFVKVATVSVTVHYLTIPIFFFLFGFLFTDNQSGVL